MTNKHTPAPWRHEPGRDGKPPHVVRGSEGGFVVMGLTAERQEADASLISASPDLLEALIEVTASLAWNAHGECRAIQDGPIMPSSMAVEVAKKAIAKARGTA